MLLTCQRRSCGEPFEQAQDTTIVRLIMAGADVRPVQELAGHKTIDMTMRSAHFGPEHKRRASGLLDVEVTAKVTTVDFTQALPVAVSHAQ
jgi:hypothetical protein